MVRTAPRAWRLRQPLRARGARGAARVGAADRPPEADEARRGLGSARSDPAPAIEWSCMRCTAPAARSRATHSSR